ncbi:glucosamine-6-phosphate deaminase [Apibacter sp. HY039]|uniref:glucosamine-6-phosphate deaminase n=1 Tax=Apibacter sp. HY039 TaxID=2501476 RepID=UPI000FEB5D17|nr:glucosamine-6-phosphate deaminase [Apibacter sp. HY039]
MKFNLSSKIVLNTVPKQFYKPENEYELSVLTRYEKIPTHIFESQVEASVGIANTIADGIKSKQQLNEVFVLGLCGDYALQTIYSELVRKHKEEGLSFENVIVFNTYEFYQPQNQTLVCLSLLNELLLDQVDIKKSNVHSPEGNIPKEEILDYCKNYERLIKEKGGLDYILVNLSQGGGVGLNFSGASINSSTRLVLLNLQARKEAINFFGTIEKVPSSAITLGISSLMKSKEIALVAWGEDKSKSVYESVEGSITDTVPATCLQNHSNASIYTDLSAAYGLTRINRPWLVSSCNWTNKLIRRAIVWLCEKLDKPILKLTNKDYQDHGLEELLSLYNSAYNVNIKVFNDLQHTITGWPGGKPNADDTNRPERSEPYPKRIILFSPHPDDDVISMGGTFRRLVEQGHDVHVAYQTSGNIAVGDEDLIRYVSLLEDVRKKYDSENIALQKKYEEILNYVLHEKKEGDSDTPDILFIKGHIRRQEALNGCRYVGADLNKAKFLDLPFYETGKIKKNPISEADVKIIKNLLQEVKPHQVFVAGDLADPHGTHKVCLDAILAAFDELKGEEWLNDCRIWMYRGAWQEWEIEHIEMAVPMSPEELRFKRNAILKHQSQMENAPFLGSDERLFWQRSEERNRTTAEKYHQLGLASYEAIEAFVEYKLL